MVLRYEDNCDDLTYAYRARTVNSAVPLLHLRRWCNARTSIRRD